MRMKKYTGIILICIFALILGACTTKSNPLEDMTALDQGEYLAIVWGEKTYIPFCAVSNDERGAKIGIVDGDENDQIYEYKGYSTDEWVISFYHSGLMDGLMLMREVNVTQIPEGLKSEYAWNQ